MNLMDLFDVEDYEKGKKGKKTEKDKAERKRTRSQSYPALCAARRIGGYGIFYNRYHGKHYRADQRESCTEQTEFYRVS